MRKLSHVVLCTAVLFAYAQIASAHGPGGAGGSPHFGGPAAGSQAAANSNGRFASDRDHGRDRAEDRKSAKAKEHEKTARGVKKEHRAQNGAPSRAANAEASSEKK